MYQYVPAETLLSIHVQCTCIFTSNYLNHFLETVYLHMLATGIAYMYIVLLDNHVVHAY